MNLEENNETYFGINPAELYREISNSSFAKGRAGKFLLKLLSFIPKWEWEWELVKFL